MHPPHSKKCGQEGLISNGECLIISNNEPSKYSFLFLVIFVLTTWPGSAPFTRIVLFSYVATPKAGYLVWIILRLRISFFFQNLFDLF